MNPKNALASQALVAPHSRGRSHWITVIPHWVFISLLSLVLVNLEGCSSNKTQTVSESYVQSVVNLSNGLVRHVNDVSRLTRATTALQQADSLIRQAVKRREDALTTFSEINADFEASPDQLEALVTTQQSASSADVEAFIDLIQAFQASLTGEELAMLYPERAEFAAQTLMLLDEH